MNLHNYTPTALTIALCSEATSLESVFSLGIGEGTKIYLLLCWDGSHAQYFPLNRK